MNHIPLKLFLISVLFAGCATTKTPEPLALKQCKAIAKILDRANSKIPGIANYHMQLYNQISESDKVRCLKYSY